MKLFYNSTLFYYDGAQIIECFDKYQLPFIGILEEEFFNGYWFIRVDLEELLEFKNKKIDLLTLIQKSYKRNQKWWILDDDNLFINNYYEPTCQMCEIPQEYLPDEGFYV
jgi:hypothetical protein